MVVERTANSMEKGGRREESRGQQSQRETGEHDVVSGERKGYFENVITGKNRSALLRADVTAEVNSPCDLPARCDLQ